MAGFRSDRFIALRQAKGLSQNKLAQMSGSTQAKINRLENDPPRNPGDLFEVARILETTVDYLFGQTDDPGPAASNPAAVAALDKSDNSVLIPQLQIGSSKGGSSVFDDYPQTATVPLPRDWLRPMMQGSYDDLFVTRYEGDSMMPTLLDGDLCIVDTSQKTIQQQDRLWCLSYGDLGMIKRVRVQPDGGALVISDNPAVENFTAYDDEMHAVGRVIWIRRRV